MIPQAPTLNRVTWEQMEDYTRKLVEQGNEWAYVIAGASGSGGAALMGVLHIPELMVKLQCRLTLGKL